MKKRKMILVAMMLLFLLAFAACEGAQSPPAEIGSDSVNEKVSDTVIENTITEAGTMLLYQGHASVRITSADGVVIYVDPYAGEGYDLPADMILVTHGHDDHNQIKLVTQKDDCVVITHKEALADGQHNSFSVKGIEIEAVEAKNSNHSIKSCVGYIITVDGIKIYHAGDTSKTDQMETLVERALDYALLPCDGVYNMNAAEAAECAVIIGAKHNIPIHTKLGVLFDRAIAEKFDAPNRLIVEPGEEIPLG